MTLHAAHASPQSETQVALSAADHTQGNASATLTLLEYGDYECPACIQAEPLTRHLVEVFGKRLRFVFRHYPLDEAHPLMSSSAPGAGSWRGSLRCATESR